MHNPVKKIVLNSLTARHLHLKNTNKPTLVFIPGNLQEIETITDFNEGFSENFNYHVIELPGTGLTKPLHPSKNISFLSKCLNEFTTKHTSKPINLVACSYATAIAIEYAKHHPNNLQSLTLAGGMQEIPQEEWTKVFNLMANCLENPKIFATDFLNSLTTNDEKVPRLKTIKRATIMKASKYNKDQFWCFIYNSIRLMSYKADKLNKIKTPSLCFTGELDPYVNLKRCKSLSDAIPNSKFTSIPKADHLFHIEKPKETIKLITDFIYKSINSPSAVA